MNKKDRELFCDYYSRLYQQLNKLDCSTNSSGVYANEKINNRVKNVKDILDDLFDDFKCEEVYLSMKDDDMEYCPYLGY
jgi:hypothetical protein